MAPRSKAALAPKKIAVRKKLATKLDLIRRENVVRHNRHAARSDLRMKQVQQQRVATMQQELDRLHGASVHGTGLDQARINRMAELTDIVARYKA
jgi:hypothetical protein